MTAGYTAVRNGGAGLIDLAERGCIRVSGSEATMFLNGLVTNDMKSLAESRWMPGRQTEDKSLEPARASSVTTLLATDRQIGEAIV